LPFKFNLQRYISDAAAKFYVWELPIFVALAAAAGVGLCKLNQVDP
jgi:hypothetical protein